MPPPGGWRGGRLGWLGWGWVGVGLVRFLRETEVGCGTRAGRRCAVVGMGGGHADTAGNASSSSAVLVAHHAQRTTCCWMFFCCSRRGSPKRGRHGPNRHPTEAFLCALPSRRAHIPTVSFSFFFSHKMQLLMLLCRSRWWCSRGSTSLPPASVCVMSTSSSRDGGNLTSAQRSFDADRWGRGGDGKGLILLCLRTNGHGKCCVADDAARPEPCRRAGEAAAAS